MKIKEYKFKHNKINNFFNNNNIYFYSKKIEKEKIIYKKEDNKKIIIFNEKTDYSYKIKILENIVFNLKFIKSSNYLYPNIRINLTDDVFLSEFLNIKLKKIDDRVKNYYILYIYFKIKNIIDRQGIDRFYKQYKVAGQNEILDIAVKHGKYNMEDYLYIITLKNIISIYSKEVDKKLDYNNPSFKDNMLFKYLENYFGKYIIIDYNENIIKKFINKYYITDIQAEDRVNEFIEKFLNLYKLIVGIEFNFTFAYEINIKNFKLFERKKAKKLKYKTFYKYFDKIIQEDNNYKTMMVLLEKININNYNNYEEEIVNIISILELLLVKGDKKISYQIQNKCPMLITKNNYTKEEFKLIYDYRSKVKHIEYDEKIKKLEEISLLKQYSIPKEDLEYELYLNKYQMLEKIIRDRILYVLKIALKNYIYKNEYVKTLKNSKE